ncbi:hypothetical protein ES703_121274 [subsurface metagenome]
MKMVGYLTKHPDGLHGQRGMFYDYVLAENGVFIEAEGPLLAARVPVAPGQIRGLAPLEPQVVLRYGFIPQRFFDLALSAMLADISKERYVAVTWNDGYHLEIPKQAADPEQVGEGADDGHGCGGGVAYLNPDKVVLDLHSHGTMTPWFSTTDNRDEQGLKLYGVIGKLGATPQVRLRVGIYGYHHPVSWGEVFEGSLLDALDALEIPLELDEDEINRALKEPSAIERFIKRIRRIE